MGLAVWLVGLLIDVAVGCDPQQLTGRRLDDGPPAGVLVRMVPRAQWREVVVAGRAAVGVVDGVVELAGPGLRVTTGCAAGAVPGGDPPLEPFAGEPAPRIRFRRRPRHVR